MNDVLLETIYGPVNVFFNDKRVELPSSIEKQVNEYWDRLLSSGNDFRRGDVFTIASVQKHQERLDIHVQLSDYAHYLSTINNVIPKEYACRVIYTAALVETSDLKIVFGEMAPNTSTPGRLQCAGGGLDLSDLFGNRFDLWHNIKSELYEELGLDLDDKNVIANFSTKYLKSGGFYNFLALIYELNLKIDSGEFVTMYDKHVSYLWENGEPPEFVSLTYLDKEYTIINNFLTKDERPRVDYLNALLGKESFLHPERAR